MLSHKIVYDYISLSEMFKQAGFKVCLLEYFDEQGTFHFHDWDERDGVIFRSKKIDPRNQNGEMVFPSLLIDAVKDEKLV